MASSPDQEGPYRLQPLLYPALPDDTAIKPDSPAAVSLAVRCAEGHGNNLYVGSSNGVIHHYVRSDEGSSNNPDQFTLVSSKVISPSGKPIERILVLFRIGVAAVVAESTLSWLHLPSLDLLPSNLLPLIRGVSTVVLDDAELDDGGIDGEGFVSLCVIKRKQAILAKVGMGRWIVVKEVPIANGVVLARRRGDSLCVATTSEYSLVNLTTSQTIPLGLPISQSSESPSASTRPSMLSFKGPGGPQGDCEFLITSHSTTQTLGVFVQTSGDPAAKLIEWHSHPRAINLEYPHLISLLRDDSIQIHNVETLEKVQTIQLPDLLEPRLLSSGQSTLEIASSSFDFGNDQVDFEITESREDLAKADDSTSSIAFRDFGTVQRNPIWSAMIFAGTPRKTNLLMTCKNAVQCLCEPVPLADAVPLLHKGRWDLLRDVVDAEWQRQEMLKVEHPTSDGMPDSSASNAVGQFYSLLTLRCVHMLDFYTATSMFPQSTLDVRLILRLFPDLWPQIDPTSVQVFSPVVELLEDWPSIHGLIQANLEWNYGSTPPIEEDDELSMLRKQLIQRAYDMIQSMLEASRTDLEMPQKLATIIDNALARVYARMAGHNQDAGLHKLSTFLSSPKNACDPADIADVARNAGASSALAELFLKRGDFEQTLAMWTSFVDGEATPQDGSTRSVADVVQLLDDCQRDDLRQKYAFWVVKHDANAGVKLLSGTDMSGGSLTSSRNPRDILQDLRSAGAHDAASRFLEQSVLNSKQQQDNADLHEELLHVLLQRLFAALDDKETKTRLSNATQEYVDGGYAEAFVGHLALQSQDEGSDGMNKVIRDRIKLIMLLQGSQVIDSQKVLAELEGQKSATNGESASGDRLLAYEMAIVLGKLQRDEEALRILALELHDANSAEAYCLQGGVVLSPFTAGQVASALGPANDGGSSTMQAYAKVISRGTRSTIKKTSRSTKDRLLKILLSIYMNAAPDSSTYNYQTATAHLLNTQAPHLSTLEILPLVPDHWPLKTLETFLTRSLRRESEQRHKGLIKRHVELSRSLEVGEESWLLARSLGGVLQEKEGDGEGDSRGRGDGRGDAGDAGESGHEAKNNLIGDVVSVLGKVQDEKLAGHRQRQRRNGDEHEYEHENGRVPAVEKRDTRDTHQHGEN